MSIVSRRLAIVCAAFVAIILPRVGVNAWQHSPDFAREVFLYRFPTAASGEGPNAALLPDRAGNLYGITSNGGSANLGTVFKLTRVGGGYAQTVLYSFGVSANDGTNPVGGLIADGLGGLYGVTTRGGDSGNGTVFKLTPKGAGYTESILYSFGPCGNSGDACVPAAGVVADNTGSLYGTTLDGGSSGEGAIYKLTRNGAGYSESIVWSFNIYADEGYNPSSNLFERGGAFYGTTGSGGNVGCMGCGGGAVFELAPAGLNVLYRFGSRVNDGSGPNSVIVDSSGAVYGTTSGGGSNGDGTVFKLTPSASGYLESILYNFKGGWDGAQPGAGLLADPTGSLFGTTVLGGSGNSAGLGTAFKLSRCANSYVETILHRFNVPGDGANPGGSLIADSTNALLGVTSNGGFGFGAVFKLREYRQTFEPIRSPISMPCRVAPAGAQ